jgi:hypothetical protein
MPTRSQQPAALTPCPVCHQRPEWVPDYDGGGFETCACDDGDDGDAPQPAVNEDAAKDAAMDARPREEGT